jgi:MoaA/NifB/PqqE/SkfB family radical SAM enzyme
MSLERITFHITDRCQLNCDHCLRDPGSKPVDLDLELIISALEQAKVLFGAKHVGLTGGEPTLHPDFYAIVDAIVDRGYTWHMVSNGARFDAVAQRLGERPARMAGLRLLNFSLDGATEQSHDAIRETGNFRTLMHALTICKARSIPFLLQMTLHARNVDEIEEVALLATQLGAAKIAYNFAQPTGTFLDESLYLPASEWRRAVDRIDRVKATFKIEAFYSETGPSEQSFHMCEMWKHANLHIDHHGRLNLCCQHAGVPSAGPISDVAGDLHTMSLAEAHRRFSEIVLHAMQARLQAIAGQNLDEWDRHFSCNFCLKHFGKPHWVEGGVGGPSASRVRWRGRWKPGYKDSHVQVDPTLSVDDEDKRPDQAQ